MATNRNSIDETQVLQAVDSDGSDFDVANQSDSDSSSDDNIYSDSDEGEDDENKI